MQKPYMDYALSSREVAALLGVSVRWLQHCRRRTRREGRLVGPPWITLAPTVVRYPRGELERWITERRSDRQGLLDDRYG